MAFSYDFFNDSVNEFVNSNFNKDSKILDIGAGAGKYGKMLNNNFHIDAVEIFKPNIEMYALHTIYKDVFNVSVVDFNFNLNQYSLVIMGDVLEHLSISDSQKVLDKIKKANASILVLVPYEYHQGIMENNEAEIHLQDDLTEDIFHARYPGFVKIFGNHLQGVFFKK